MLSRLKMSSAVSKTCYLLNLESSRKVNLPKNEPKEIGRNRETQVTDLFVSRKQLECTANLDACTVDVKPIGMNSSGIDGYATVAGRTYTIGHGHIIELRRGHHQFEVVFESEGDGADEEELDPAAKKPKLDFPIFNSDKGVTSTFSENGKWEDIDNKELLIYTPEGLQAFPKIAAFDIDSTIVKTKSGKKFPKDSDDWILNYAAIPQQLRKLVGEGFKVVFFTNQLGVGKDSSKIKEFKRKIESIIRKLEVPVQVFAALGRGIYRKPLPGMWDVLKEKKNDDVELDVSECFYVGDAAGRNISKTKKDHSVADRLFALNVGLKFYTPEEYFLKASPEPYAMPEFNPANVAFEEYPAIDYETPNVVLMVGLPGSGKSHVCRELLLPIGYVHANRDKLGSWQKCAKALEEALREGKSCVVDNTNVDRESRKRFVDVARNVGADIRCFVMATTYQHAKHNNRFRELTDKTHVPVADMVINTLKKSYQEPELAEGFEEIVSVRFVPKFENEEDEKLYRMFLLEK